MQWRADTLLDSVTVSLFFFIYDLTNSQLTIWYYCETGRLVNTLQNFRNREEMVHSGSLAQKFAYYGSHQYVLSKEQLVSGMRGDKTSFGMGWGNAVSDLLSDSVIQKPAVAAMGQSGVKHQIE